MKKFILNISISLLIVLLLVVSYYLYDNEKNKEIFINNKKILTDINKHYNKYVITTKKSNIYKKINGKYISIGTINSGEKLTLKDTIIKLSTRYIKIDNTNYYIYYKDVEKIDEFVRDKH